jgi:hypothetical protein
MPRIPARPKDFPVPPKPFDTHGSLAADGVDEDVLNVPKILARTAPTAPAESTAVAAGQES